MRGTHPEAAALFDLLHHRRLAVAHIAHDGARQHDVEALGHVTLTHDDPMRFVPVTYVDILLFMCTKIFNVAVIARSFTYKVANFLSIQL